MVIESTVMYMLKNVLILKKYWIYCVLAVIIISEEQENKTI